MQAVNTYGEICSYAALMLLSWNRAIQIYKYKYKCCADAHCNALRAYALLADAWGQAAETGIVGSAVRGLPDRV